MNPAIIIRIGITGLTAAFYLKRKGSESNLAELQPDDFGSFGFFLKVAKHRVFYHRSQIVPILPLREDAVAERTRPEAAFFGLANLENYFAHGGTFPENRLCCKSRFSAFLAIPSLRLARPR